MKKSFVTLFLLSVSASFANTPNQTISIKNNTDLSLDLGLTVPKRTAVVITMTKLKDAQEMLNKAILDNSAEGIKEAVIAGANVNLGKDGKAPVIMAVILKKSKAVEALLKYGANANISWEGQSVLQYACINKDIQSSLFLLKNGATISEDLIIKALWANSQELVQGLVKNGYNISRMSQQAWFIAISFQDITKLKIILDNGANPNQVLTNGETPLMLAIATPQHSLVKVKALLEAGAKPDQKARFSSPSTTTTTEHTPLSYAASLGKSEIVEFLLEHGATL